MQATADALSTTTVVNWFPALPQYYFEEYSSSALISNDIWTTPLLFKQAQGKAETRSVYMNGGPHMLIVMERLLQETQAFNWE